MSNILDNSKEFFDNLTKEEFDRLFDKFKFKYKKLEDLTPEEINLLRNSK